MCICPDCETEDHYDHDTVTIKQEWLEKKVGTGTKKITEVIPKSFQNYLHTIFCCFYVTNYVAKDTKTNPVNLFPTICVLFLNGCAGPATSVGADDPGNDQTENPEDGRDQRIRLQCEGRTIMQLTLKL